MMSTSLSRREALAFTAAGVIAAGASMRGARAAGAFEEFQPRPVGQVVPPDLIQGPHFHLTQNVRTYDCLNQFVATSDYGVFSAGSDTMLRRLVKEINAISVLQGITTTQAYGQAVEQAAMGSVRGVENLVTQPVQTAEAVPNAIFDVFARAGSAIESNQDNETTKYEDSAAAQLLQMSSYKRDYCKQLGVDPYSSNPVLQKQLNSVAWAAAMGNLTVGAATMVSGSAAISAFSYARNIDQAIDTVNADPPAELMRRNREMLNQMGINPALQEEFLSQQQYSPRAKTLLISALAAMQNTEGRASMLDVACTAPNETAAIFYQQMAELLNSYDEKIAPITKLARYNRLTIGYEQSGRAVMLAPLDWVVWNEKAANAATRLAEGWHLKPGGDTLQLWITGTASPRFAKEARALGVQVTENIGSRLSIVD